MPLKGYQLAKHTYGVTDSGVGVEGCWMTKFIKCPHCNTDNAVEIEVDVQQEGALSDPHQCRNCLRLVMVYYTVEINAYR